eukprot:CAMPEP_0201584332 /NCGR_PEP_ID=MMETSP0190_2-20130828/109331_1 /ASSEMBLY_ACC=CAM_ASM_000263 /TAXON_ID=37353 /ORGANISM="Rosalina sp." /LENGTH=79 /DNA_ID=CAMNT_0048028069 /DNA_START=114 /DNA_END=350 /DNA_ORIENTATION=+
MGGSSSSSSSSSGPSFSDKVDYAISYDKRQYFCEEAYGGEYGVSDQQGRLCAVYNGNNKYAEGLYRDADKECKKYEAKW